MRGQRCLRNNGGGGGSKWGTREGKQEEVVNPEEFIRQ